MDSESAGRTVMLAIRPHFAFSIISGHKRVEFRKVRFRSKVSHAVIYATSPIQKVIGYFEVLGLCEGRPMDLWRRHHRVAGIDRSEFESYFAGSPQGIAIEIGKVHMLGAPISLSTVGHGIRAPQSFVYISKKAFSNIRSRSSAPVLARRASDSHEPSTTLRAAYAGSSSFLAVDTRRIRLAASAP